MKLSMCTAKLSDRFSDKGAIKILSNAGFDAFDFTMKFGYGKGYLEYADEIRKYADELGIICNQAHAPIPSSDSGTEYEEIVHSIEMAARIGAKVIVIHPLKDRGDGYRWQKKALFERNMAFFRSLIPHAEKHNIKIAIENMYSPDPDKKTIVSGVCSHSEEFCEYIDTLASEYIVACLDTGHAALVSDTVPNLLDGLGKRVQALHIHDVDYINDSHALPYTGKLDWNSICKALAETDYQGDFTYEACNFFSEQMDDELVPIAAKYAEQVGRSLIGKIEKAKK